MARRNIILKEWVKIREVVLPASASEKEIEERRRTFFAGAYCMMAEIRKIQHAPDDAIEATWDSLEKELELYREMLTQEDQEVT